MDLNQKGEVSTYLNFEECYGFHMAKFPSDQQRTPTSKDLSSFSNLFGCVARMQKRVEKIRLNVLFILPQGCNTRHVLTIHRHVSC